MFHKHPLRWLTILGLLSAALYVLAAHEMPFRAPHMDQTFFLIFGALFVVYALATWIVLRAAPLGRSALALLFGFALLFNAILLPTIPNLSDDMFRYIWDGRVQASGFNPYRYASDAPPLILLRDAEVWGRMNRRDATTIYPPGAQIVFAISWRLVGDSLFAFKALFVGACFIGAALLVQLLKRLGQAPERVIVFLWSPLLIFEIAHSGHVDALYLPLIAAALLVRVASPADRVDWRYEAALGILVGLAILVKLYPAILIPSLWALRDSQGRRRWRLAFPLAALLVTGLGYALYIAPGVDTLGFLPRYTQEFFNIGPLPLSLIDWSQGNHWPWYAAISALMPALIALMSLYFVLFPARTAREAVQRCIYPIGVYILINHNLFSWYVLWLLPFIALELNARQRFGWQTNQAFAWWIFTGLTALSYTIFITGLADQDAIRVEFVILYILLVASVFAFLYRRFRTNWKGKPA